MRQARDSILYKRGIQTAPSTPSSNLDLALQAESSPSASHLSLLKLTFTMSDVAKVDRCDSGMFML